MNNEYICPEMDIESKDVPSETDDERTDAERYRDLLLEACEVSFEAQNHLHLFNTRPECALLILKDYLKEIESICSI